MSAFREGRVGLYGGTFNPIHLGHLILAEVARERLELPVLHLVPSGSPPHKPPGDLAPAADRLAMARLAVRGNPHLRVLDLEVRREGKSYTIDTLRTIRRRMRSGAELYFLIGADSIPELPTWRETPAIIREARVVTLDRPGYEDAFERVRGQLPDGLVRELERNRLETPRIDISSSDIRRRIREGRSARYLAPDAVLRYAARQGLYRPDPGAGGATEIP
jgi:nicotinate-nucleotide adenylyltransferase